jgi:hypothetical protein
MSARLLGQGWQGKRENACVPFVDVGSALAICLVCAMGIHTTRRLSLCCVRMRDPVRAQYTVHTLCIAGRGWHISGLVGGRCCYIDRCLGALVSLGCRKTLLSTSSASFPSAWPPCLDSWSVESVFIIRGDGSYTHGMLWGLFPLSRKRVTPHRILRLRQPNVVACHHGSIRLCADGCQEQACNIAQCTVDMRALHKRRTEPGGRSSLAASQSCLQ